MTYSVELELAVGLAKQAGEMGQAIQAQGFEVWNKNGNKDNPVTDADKAISQFLVSKIQQAFPDDVVISEEAEIPDIPLANKRIWFIDPIDGTKEFIAGINEWSVMIGLVQANQPCLGVVYQPDLNQLYYATKHSGAFFINDQGTEQLSVRRLKSIQDAVLIQSRSHWSETSQKIAYQFGITKTLKQGSIGLKLGKIARGYADLYFNFSGHCHLWDLCAPQLILQEAGGEVQLVTGAPIFFQTLDTLIREGFIAGTKELIHKIGCDLI